MVPKKPAPKSMKKPVEKPVIKTKKIKKKNYQSFSIYIYKILKSVAKDLGPQIRISKKSMMIMESFVNDMLEKIAVEAGRLTVHGKKTTLGSREIQSALRLLLPGELSKHANIEGIKAITSYHRSVQQDTGEN